MKKTTAICTFLLLGASIGAASAAQLGLRGSDTLGDMTKEVLSKCGATGIPSTDINYEGGGSSAGEDAMKAKTQQVSPMSRFLDNARTCSHPDGKPDLAEGLNVALDGLSIVTSTAEEAACSGGVRVTGTLPSGYAFGANGLAPWKDALRLVFTGINNTSNAIANKKCDSVERQELIAQWSRFFEGGCSGPSQCTGALRHAYRRADLSGTTDTFLSLLSLPAITTLPFCNGATYEESDPITTPCLGDEDASGIPEEQVCRANGKLGVVLPVFVPPIVTTATDTDKAPSNADEQYPKALCGDGFFSYLSSPNDRIGAPLIGCPNGTTSLFGKCLTPYRVVAGQNNYSCINKPGNCPFGTPLGNECRGYNAQLRKPKGQPVRDELEKGDVHGSYYRMHSFDSPDNTLCFESEATTQIGCLVAHGRCSIGFAGREAADNVAGVQALKVGGVYPTDDKIRGILTSDPTRYMLARKLYFNTHIGFENVLDGATTAPGSERKLAECFADRTIVDAAATKFGFTTLGTALRCEDFDEKTACGKATNFDACSNNPAPFPR